MADETTIWVAGVTAFATLISGWGGYWLAGRNEQAGATSLGMAISWTAPMRASRRRRRSKGDSSQLLITPSSPQTLHRHRIDEPGSLRCTISRPGQRRLAGRRRHGSALSQAIWASPAVAARTMLLRCSASRRAGPGVSGGRSRKWCRSVTNISATVTNPGLVGDSVACLGQPVVRRWRARASRYEVVPVSMILPANVNWSTVAA